MASITKHKNGWRAHVARQGVRKSKLFDSKREAQDWAARQEYLILNGEKAAAREKLLHLFDRYAREVSPTKRGARWEQIRLEKLSRDSLAQKRLGDLTAQDFASWRDRRLQEVSGGTVRREMELLSAVLIVARKEWGLIGSNPMADVRRPANNPARDRVVTGGELEKLAVSAGDDVGNATARAFQAFLFSCETAMRAGEVVGLTWDRVDLDRRVARLDKTKNGTARDVPLSTAAVDILRRLDGLHPSRCFVLSSAQLDSLFRKLRDRAGVLDLRYHDSRHSAITRLAGKLEVLELARMVGHRDLRQLLTYYNETAESLARKLD